MNISQQSPHVESELISNELGDCQLTTRRGIVTEDGMQAIGKRIEHYRKLHGISQMDMASKLGVTQTIISRMELGEARIHGELIMKLVKIFGISADELLGIRSTKPVDGTIGRRWVKRMSRVDELVKRDQDALARIIDAFLERNTKKAAS